MAGLYIILCASLFGFVASVCVVATVAHEDQSTRAAFLCVALFFGLLSYRGFTL